MPHEKASEQVGTVDRCPVPVAIHNARHLDCLCTGPTGMVAFAAVYAAGTAADRRGVLGDSSSGGISLVWDWDTAKENGKGEGR